MSNYKDIHKEAKQRIPTQKEKILNLLKSCGDDGALNTELVNISLRFTALIFDLKSEGYNIITENVKYGVVKYILKEGLIKREKYKKGVDIVKEDIVANYNGGINGEQLEAILNKYGLNIVRKPNVLHKV